MRRALAPALAAALALAAGCARCGRTRQGPPPERWLPAEAPLSVVVTDLGAAGRQLGGVYRTVAAVPAAVRLAEAFSAVKSQLGFDPLDPGGLEDAGLATSGGGGASLALGQPALLVLPVADLSRFDAMALRLARDRMGASQRVTSTGAGRQVVTFRREATGASALAYAVVDGYALMAAGSTGPAALESAASLPEERSLAKSAAWLAARGAVGATYPFLAFAPPRSPAVADVPAARDGAALALRAGAASLRLRLALPLAADRAVGWKALAGDSAEAARQAGLAEVRLLPPDAALTARWGGEPAALGRKLWPLLPPRARADLEAARLDLVGDLLEALAPGVALAASIPPSLTLAEFSSPDPRRADPFRLVNVEALLRVRDADRVRVFFGRLAQAAPRWGGKVVSKGPAASATAWTLLLGGGRLSCFLAGGQLAVAGGSGRLESLEKRLAAGSGGFEPPTAASRAALAGGVGGAALDVDHLLASIRGLPEGAYGSGPDAFVMRSLADRFLEPASHLRAVSLRFDLATGAALFDLEVEGREGGPGP
jgi:hypothetical protein